MQLVDQCDPCLVRGYRLAFGGEGAFGSLTGQVVVPETIEGPADDGRDDEEDDAARRPYGPEVGDDMDGELLGSKEDGGYERTGQAAPQRSDEDVGVTEAAPMASITIESKMNQTPPES